MVRSSFSPSVPLSPRSDAGGAAVGAHLEKSGAPASASEQDTSSAYKKASAIKCRMQTGLKGARRRHRVRPWEFRRAGSKGDVAAGGGSGGGDGGELQAARCSDGIRTWETAPPTVRDEPGAPVAVAVAAAAAAAAQGGRPGGPGRGTRERRRTLIVCTRAGNLSPE